MSHLPRILFAVLVLATLIGSPAQVRAQSVPNPVCAYCNTPLPNGVHSSSCPYSQSNSESGGSESTGSRSGGHRPSLTSRDINHMVTMTLFESLLTSMFTTTSTVPTEQEALAARQKAFEIARQQLALKKAREAAARAEHARMMTSYKQLNDARETGFKTLSDSNVGFKTLDGDLEALAAGARKPFDTAGTLKPPSPGTPLGGGTPFFGDSMPVTTVQFLAQPENDPNVVDLRNAQTFVVQSLKKDSNDLDKVVQRYDKNEENGQPIVRPPDCVKSAKRLKELVQQRNKFQKTVDLAQEQLTTWQDANRNALLNAAQEGLSYFTGHLLERFTKRGQAADRLQRIYDRNAAKMAQQGLNIAEIQAKIQRLKAWSTAGRLAELASTISDWQTFTKDGVSALVAQLTASNQEIEQMLEDPRLRPYFETEAAELKALLDISKIAASNKVFGKWVAKKMPLIAGVELAINETYHALDWYLSYKRIAEAHAINGRVLDAARQLQQDIDDTYLALRECP